MAKSTFALLKERDFKQILTVKLDRRVPTVQLSPDGKRFLLYHVKEGSIEVYATADGKLCSSLDGGMNHVLNACFTADGRVLSSSMDNTFRLWDGDNGKEVQRQSVRNATIGISSDGRFAVTASTDNATNGSLQMWSLTDPIVDHKSKRGA